MNHKRSVPVNTTYGLSSATNFSQPSRIHPRHALLIGIEYLDTPAELLGCRRDVLRFKHLITSRLGFSPHQTHLLLENQATYNGICQQLSRCVEISKSTPTDFIIYFSGHGTGIQGGSTSESDGQDEAIVPYDHLDKGLLDDNTIWSYLKQLSNQSHCLCVWDSCNSGTVADLGYILNGGGLTRDTGGRICPATVISVSGCRDSQTSSVVKDDTGWNSALTSAVIEVFQKSGWNISLPEMLSGINQYMKREDLSQRSVVSTSQVVDLTQKIGVLMGVMHQANFLDLDAQQLYKALQSDLDPTVRLLSDLSLLDLTN